MIYIDLGRRELGKTTLAVWMALRCPFRIFIDPRNMIAIDGAVRVTTPAELVDAELRMIDGEVRTIVVMPRRDIPQMFEAVCRFVFAWSEDFPDAAHAIALVIDEARIINNARRPGDTSAARVLETSDAFDDVLRMTPRELTHVIMTAHRPQDIPTDIRAITDQWLLFRSTQEHDLKQLRDVCGDRLADKLTRLDPYQFICYRSDRGSYTEHRDPKVWFVPLRPASERSTDLIPTSHETEGFILS